MAWRGIPREKSHTPGRSTLQHSPATGYSPTGFICTTKKELRVNLPPFSAHLAASVRQRLGMSHWQVAQQMSALQAPTHPDLIAAWEAGYDHPTEKQLFALADVLWCRTVDLMDIDKPRTLREFRLARQFTVSRLTRAITMDTAEYREAEKQNRWWGNRHQTLALLNTLNISLAELLNATDRSTVRAAKASA